MRYYFVGFVDLLIYNLKGVIKYFIIYIVFFIGSLWFQNRMIFYLIILLIMVILIKYILFMNFSKVYNIVGFWI